MGRAMQSAYASVNIAHGHSEGQNPAKANCKMLVLYAFISISTERAIRKEILELWWKMIAQ